MIIAGTRPEFIKLAPVIKAISTYDDIELIFVHSEQHYDAKLSDIFFRELNLPLPQEFLNIGSGTHSEQTSRLLIECERVITSYKPDLIFVEGDTNTVLGAGLAAIKLHLPLAHVEAGLRSYDRMMPEEINRIVVGLCAELHFAPTKRAALNLVYEGIPPKKIFVTGNTVVDMCNFFSKIAKQNSTILNDLGIQKNKKLVILTLHRPENVDNEQNLGEIIEGVMELCKDDHQIVFPAHPRTKKMLEKMQFDYASFESFFLIDPVGYLDFLHLLIEADLVVTDSGGVQEEALTLRCPCLTTRRNTERPETVEVGANILIGTKKDLLLKYARKILSDEHFASKMRPSFNPLGDGLSGERIVKIARERCSFGIQIDSPTFLKAPTKTFRLFKIPSSLEGITVANLKKKFPEIEITLVYDQDGYAIFPQDEVILRKNWSLRISGIFENIID